DGVGGVAGALGRRILVVVAAAGREADREGQADGGDAGEERTGTLHSWCPSCWVVVWFGGNVGALDQRARAPRMPRRRQAVTRWRLRSAGTGRGSGAIVGRSG